MTHLRDGIGRHITYLRISVTDRCDLRCRYCMSESMSFLPRKDMLSNDEFDAIVDRFVMRGIRKIRITGGEPLVRRETPDLMIRLGRHLHDGALDELTLTTNGNLLEDHASTLAKAGMRRINVSLDTLDPHRFRHVTRRGELSRTLRGIGAAKAAGLRVKINMVALKNFNEDEFETMLGWCGEEGHDLTLIETMPLGPVDEDRIDRYLPLDIVRKRLEGRFTLTPSSIRTGGPARYFDVAETGQRLGFITPLTHDFCSDCNRVRLTADGKLYMCLGHEDRVDLKTAYREGGLDRLDAMLDEALRLKPPRHFFEIAPNTEKGPARHMSVTGG